MPYDIYREVKDLAQEYYDDYCEHLEFQLYGRQHKYTADDLSVSCSTIFNDIYQEFVEYLVWEDLKITIFQTIKLMEYGSDKSTLPSFRRNHLYILSLESCIDFMLDYSYVDEQERGIYTKWKNEIHEWRVMFDGLQNKAKVKCIPLSYINKFGTAIRRLINKTDPTHKYLLSLFMKIVASERACTRVLHDNNVEGY